MREDKKTGFTRLDPNDDLVKMLISEIWWNELVKLSNSDRIPSMFIQKWEIY